MVKEPHIRPCFICGRACLVPVFLIPPGCPDCDYDMALATRDVKMRFPSGPDGDALKEVYMSLSPKCVVCKTIPSAPDLDSLCPDCFSTRYREPLIDERRTLLLRLSLVETSLAKVCDRIAGPDPSCSAGRALHYFCKCGAEFLSFLSLNNHIASEDDGRSTHGLRSDANTRSSAILATIPGHKMPPVPGATSGQAQRRYPSRVRGFDPKNLA